MMNQINYNQIDEETQREIELEFKTKYQYVLCPFDLVDGIDDISQGIYSNDPNRFQSESFNRVFQGRNPVIAIWQNSTKSINQTTEGGVPDYSKPAKKQFTTGSWMPAILEVQGETYMQSFSDDMQGNKKFSTSISYTMRVQKEISREYWYRWYVLPEFGNDFLYIENISVYRGLDGNVIYSEITLRKVIDQLEFVTTNATTLISKSSPGENYAWPKLYDLDDDRALIKGVTLDQDALLNNSGIKYLQLTSLEPMLLGSFYAWGRPTDTEYIHESRILGPARLCAPSSDPILGINAPSEKFLWAEQGRVTIGKEYESWWKAFTQGLKDIAGFGTNDQIKNYGAVKIEDIDTAILSAPDKVKVDSAGNSFNVAQTYWDNWIIQAQSEIVYDGFQGYKTFSPYANERILNESTLAHDKLFRNIFITQQMVQLPFEYESKIAFGLVNMVVGGIRKIILGQDAQYITNNSTNRTSKVDIPLMVEHSYLNLISKGLMSGDAGDVDAKKYLPLQLFSGDRPEIITGKNINTFNIKIELSDLINSKDKGVINTVDLGKLNEDGSQIYFSEEFSAKRSTTGYALDRIIIQGISKGDIKITAFDESDVAIGSFIAETNSKKTGSILDWTTMIKTSMWESESTVDVTPEVPEPSYKGDDEVILNDRILTAVINRNESFENIIDVSINLFDEFKEQSGYDDTLERWLQSHTVSFTAAASINHTSTEAVVTARHSAGGLVDTSSISRKTSVLSTATTSLSYDSINELSSDDIAPIEPFILKDSEFDIIQQNGTDSNPTVKQQTQIKPKNINIDDQGILTFSVDLGFTYDYTSSNPELYGSWDTPKDWKMIEIDGASVIQLPVTYDVLGPTLAYDSGKFVVGLVSNWSDVWTAGRESSSISLSLFNLTIKAKTIDE